MTSIRNMTADEIKDRTGRFSGLTPMSTAKSLADKGVPLAAVDVIFARKLMPIVLEDTTNPFGNNAPIFGAGGMSLHLSICPPGQGPCLHSHNSTYETFICLEGRWEFSVGDKGQEKIVLEKWDTFSCPPRVYRGFRNIWDRDSALLTVISGPADARDDVSMPPIVAEQLKSFGADNFEAIQGVFQFDE
jgi:quercetin dioxygenase-like cupin family protein